MSVIIHPDECSCGACSEARNQAAAEDARLRHIYETNAELRALADKIHHNRLMSGPACEQCIAMAERKLKQ